MDLIGLGSIDFTVPQLAASAASAVQPTLSSASSGNSSSGSSSSGGSTSPKPNGTISKKLPVVPFARFKALVCAETNNSNSNGNTEQKEKKGKKEKTNKTEGERFNPWTLAEDEVLTAAVNRWADKLDIEPTRMSAEVLEEHRQRNALLPLRTCEEVQTRYSSLCILNKASLVLLPLVDFGLEDNRTSRITTNYEMSLPCRYVSHFQSVEIWLYRSYLSQC